MSKKKRGKKDPLRSECHYPLAEVKELVSKEAVFITRRATVSARGDFEWGRADILDALSKLEKRHFDKREVASYNRWLVFDCYKAFGLNGEDVYTHFYIDDSVNKLIVNSFHKI